MPHQIECRVQRINADVRRRTEAGCRFANETAARIAAPSIRHGFDVVNIAEGAGINNLLRLYHLRGVAEFQPGHQDFIIFFSSAPHRRSRVQRRLHRFLAEDMFAGVQRSDGGSRMHPGWGADIDCLNLVYFQHFVVVAKRLFDTPPFFRAFQVCRDEICRGDNLRALNVRERSAVCLRDTTRTN